MEYRLEANLGAVDWKLTEEEVAHLDEASYPGLP
jgi:diketogulonate reductase-like aldo/keto reductase